MREGWVLGEWGGGGCGCELGVCWGGGSSVGGEGELEGVRGG